METMLACTVRGCGRPLARRALMMACDQGHSFDVARTGYINLLQPQDRRSLDAGDSKDVVAARSRLLTAGLGRAAVDAMVERIAALQFPEDAPIADLGCGSGDALASIAGRCRLGGAGIDISPAAIEHAVRPYPALTWVVANADRRLPFLDGSLAALLSLNARRNPYESSRVLSAGGILIVAVPAADDLIELRAAVQGEGVERDRMEAVIAAHAPAFDVVHRESVRERHHLGNDTLTDLLRITYRGARRRAAASAEGLTEMDVTLSSEIVVLERR